MGRGCSLGGVGGGWAGCLGRWGASWAVGCLRGTAPPPPPPHAHTPIHPCHLTPYPRPAREQDERDEPTKVAVGMFSGEAEYVEFAADCICDGPVESWLQNVVDSMKLALTVGGGGVG